MFLSKNFMVVSLFAFLVLPQVSQASCVSRTRTADKADMIFELDNSGTTSGVRRTDRTVTVTARKCGIGKTRRAIMAASRAAAESLASSWEASIEGGAMWSIAPHLCVRHYTELRRIVTYVNTGLGSPSVHTNDNSYGGGRFNC